MLCPIPFTWLSFIFSARFKISLLFSVNFFAKDTFLPMDKDWNLPVEQGANDLLHRMILKGILELVSEGKRP